LNENPPPYYSYFNLSADDFMNGIENLSRVPLEINDAQKKLLYKVFKENFPQREVD
jgi:hypothetical protein